MFTHVLTLILDSTFSQLIDQKLRSEAYRLLPLDAGSTARIQDVTDNDPTTASAKLATIMAVMTKEAYKIGNGVPNMYVQALESVSDLEAFAAVIYSSNLELEASVKIMTPPMPTQSITEPDAEAEKPIIPEAGIGLIDKAAGGVNATWSGFRSVWGKVIGKGDEQMTK